MYDAARSLHGMSVILIKLYAAADEATDSATGDLLVSLRQKGVKPKISAIDSDDQITVVCELHANLFDSALEAIKGWGHQHPGRDVGTKEPPLITLQSRRTFTMTLLLQRPIKKSATTP